MNLLLLLMSVFTTSCLARPISLFHLAFQEVPVRDAWSKPTDIRGGTPADTYPLVLRPHSFAPAVAAPPSWLYPAPIRESTPFGTRHQIKGAIPLFQPFLTSHFANYLQFAPVRTTFYLSEPNMRFQEHLEDEIPYTKLTAAPPPAFIPVRDAQIPDRRRQKPDSQIKESISTQATELELGNAINGDIEIKTFPQQIGPLFEFRGDNSLKYSAPGGIVKSAQPIISREKFSNSKFSHFLKENSATRSGLSDNNAIVLV